VVQEKQVETEPGIKSPEPSEIPVIHAKQPQNDPEIESQELIEIPAVQAKDFETEPNISKLVTIEEDSDWSFTTYLKIASTVTVISLTFVLVVRKLSK
jgi:hypothetical protein